MKHVTYGLFDDATRAREAATILDTTSAPHGVLGVVLEVGPPGPSSYGLTQSAASQGALGSGLVMGALGAVFGAVAGGGEGLVAFGTLSAMYGGVAGALVGAGGPERKLAELEKGLRDGTALVIVEAPSIELRDRADDVMLAYGAAIHHKPIV